MTDPNAYLQRLPYRSVITSLGGSQKIAQMLLEWVDPHIRTLEGKLLRTDEYVETPILNIVVSNVFKVFLMSRHVKIIFGAQMEVTWTSSQTQETTNTGVHTLVSREIQQVVSKSTIEQSCADLEAHCTTMLSLKDKGIERRTGLSSGKYQRIIYYPLPLGRWRSISWK